VLDEAGIRANFEGVPRNVGLVLGEASGDLVDVDLDVPEAAAIAGHFLPPTLVSGRPGNPRSHYWFVSPGAGSVAYKDTDGRVLVEIRANGRQTVVPPSVHPRGERIVWYDDAGKEPAPAEAEDLERRCRLLTTAALVARHLPDGGRHDFAMALAGFLLRPGRLVKEQALGIMVAAWDAAGYPNGKSRAEAMRDLEGILGDTGVRLGEGKRVWGGPTLGEMTPDLPDALEKIWGWKEARAPANEPNTVSAADLLTKEFPPINWVVPGVLPEGVTLLAGKPKIGKSWLMLDLCLGVAHRGVVLGTKEVERGPCLYLALEDNPRRLQRRLRKLTESGLGTHGSPEGFDIATEWPRMGEGCEEALRDWLNRNPGARAIVVDTLAKIRPRQKGQNV
jgi:hypothetical protein